MSHDGWSNFLAAMAGPSPILPAQPEPGKARVNAYQQQATADINNNDLELVQSCLRGNEDAFAKLVDTHQQMVGRRMWRFTRNRSDWEELVHDVFVQAYFSLATFRGRGSLAGWLSSIATRVGYRYWKEQARKRARKHIPLDELPECALRQPEAINEDEAAEILARLLDTLPPRDRLVVTLLYVEGHSIAEAARLSGWSRVMVRVQAHRARSRLRRQLARLDNSRQP